MDVAERDVLGSRRDGLRRCDVGAADTFPFLVNVRPYRPAGERRPRSTGPRPGDDEQYADYYRRDTGEEPPPGLLELFREVLEEVADASA